MVAHGARFHSCWLHATHFDSAESSVVFARSQSGLCVETGTAGRRK